MNYTKGKWKAYKTATGWCICVEEDAVADVYSCHAGLSEANAQLIASAPLGYELADFVAHISSTWIEEGVLQIGEGDYTRMKTLALDLIRKVNRGD